jgi:uncharacterized membrane protein
MLIINLTIPPLIILYLAPTILSNASLPAPPLSQVAAYMPNGTPIPSWVVGGRLYVLQDGEPAVVEYVPQYTNTSGVLALSVEAAGGAVAVAPPGIMIYDISPPNYSIVAVNKSGLYIAIRASNATIKYAPIAITISSTATSSTTTAAATTATAPAKTTSAPSTTAASSSSATSAALPVAIAYYVYAAVAAAAATAAIYFLAARLSSRREDCAGLSDTDLYILRALDKLGGRAARPALAQALGLPASTLHKHLHKLSRYGYIRLVAESGVQKVELLKKC